MIQIWIRESPYKRGFVSLNKSVINYLTKYTHHLLYLSQSNFDFVLNQNCFLSGGEFVFAIFVFYYFIEEILEMKKMKMEYFYSFWNQLDMFVIAVSFKI